jgi:hypothetical protein
LVASGLGNFASWQEMKVEDALFMTFDKIAQPNLLDDLQQQRGFGRVSGLHK